MSSRWYSAIGASSRIPLLFFAALSSLLILPFLSLIPIYQVSEAREGVVVNAMLESGNYLLPLRHAELIPSKPPLFHWLGAGAAYLLGEFQEFGLRLPSAIAAILLICSLYGLVAQLCSHRAAVLASCFLVSTYGFVRMAADGRVDMLFCFFVCLAVFRWMLTLARLKNGPNQETLSVEGSIREIAFYCGLAVLSKGPLGAVLPIAIIVALSVFEMGPLSLRYLMRVQWVWALIVCVPWYVFAGLLGGEQFLARQLFFENVHRFVGGAGISAKPPWFYLLEFWGQAAPWSILVVLLLIFFRRWPSAQERPAGVNIQRMSLVWILCTIVLLSLSSGKRSAYLLPILPPLALGLGVFLDRRWDSLGKGWSDITAKSFTRNGQMVGQCVWLITVTAIAAFWLLGFTTPSSINISSDLSLFRHGAQVVIASAGVHFALAFSFLSLLSLYCFRLAYSRRALAYLCAAIFLYVQLVLVVLVNLAYGVKGETHTYRDFAAAVQSRAGGEPLTFVKRQRDESFDGFFFYFARTVRLYDPGLSAQFDRLKHSSEIPITPDILPAGPPQEPGLYLMRRRWFAAMDEAWLRRVEEIYEGGRLVDKPEELVVLFRLKPLAVNHPTDVQPEHLPSDVELPHDLPLP